MTDQRKRLRDLGISIGRFPTGRWNAITDVEGVRVGHVTLVEGEGPLVPGKGPVRTGVTAIVPRSDMFHSRLVGAAYVLNGAGEVSGLTSSTSGLETPPAHNTCLARRVVLGGGLDGPAYPEILVTAVIPVVGRRRQLAERLAASVGSDVLAALDSAAEGPVAEGAVGGGTGMVCCDFKGGIGTSSRVVAIGSRRFTIGVLAMTNFGVMRDLRIDGLRIGEILEADIGAGAPRRRFSQGSIICVLATDAPLVSGQVRRLCKRAALGVGRAGSHAEPASGEIMVGFSRHPIPRLSSGTRSTDWTCC
jgi:D-aminopeptidase